VCLYPLLDSNDPDHCTRLRYTIICVIAAAAAAVYFHRRSRSTFETAADDVNVSLNLFAVFRDLRRRHQVEVGRLFVDRRDRVQTERQTAAPSHLRRGPVCHGSVQRGRLVDPVRLVAGTNDDGPGLIIGRLRNARPRLNGFFRYCYFVRRCHEKSNDTYTVLARVSVFGNVRHGHAD